MYTCSCIISYAINGNNLYYNKRAVCLFVCPYLISFPSLLKYPVSEELTACIYNECNKLINIESY